MTQCILKLTENFHKVINYKITTIESPSEFQPLIDRINFNKSCIIAICDKDLDTTGDGTVLAREMKTRGAYTITWTGDHYNAFEHRSAGDLFFEKHGTVDSICSAIYRRMTILYPENSEYDKEMNYELPTDLQSGKTL